MPIWSILNEANVRFSEAMECWCGGVSNSFQYSYSNTAMQCQNIVRIYFKKVYMRYPTLTRHLTLGAGGVSVDEVLRGLSWQTRARSYMRCPLPPRSMWDICACLHSRHHARALVDFGFALELGDVGTNSCSMSADNLEDWWEISSHFGM